MYAAAVAAAAAAAEWVVRGIRIRRTPLAPLHFDSTRHFANSARQAGWAKDLAVELVFFAKLDGTGTLDQLDSNMTKRVSRHETCPQVAHCIQSGHKCNLSRRVGRFCLIVVVPLFLQ
jgi:hypothetical protein